MAPQAKAATISSAAANGRNGHSLISDEKFRQLYSLALRVRLHATFAGREAALAGVAADLRGGDLLLAAESASLASLLCSCVPNLLVPAPHADPRERLIEVLGAALAARLRKSGDIAVVLLPDVLLSGPSGQALLQEAYTIADCARLPVVFVEREVANEAAPHPRSRSNGKAAEFEIPAIPVDAHDVIAMYRVAHESIARARKGSGPTRILCVKHPASHFSRAGASSGDAVSNLESWLEARGLPAHAWRQEIATALHPTTSGSAQQD